MSVEVKVLLTHTNLMLTQINEVHKLLMVRPSSETTKVIWIVKWDTIRFKAAICNC